MVGSKTSLIYLFIAALFSALFKGGRVIKHDDDETWTHFIFFHARVWFSRPRSFKLLRSSKILPFNRLVVEARSTPAFYLVIPDPALDVVISWHIANAGVWDERLTELVIEVTCVGMKHTAIFTSCADSSRAHPHAKHLNHASPKDVVLDVGANVGWFSFLAASRNHTAIAFEPQVMQIQNRLLSIHV